jgi:chromosome segregation ATPase
MLLEISVPVYRKDRWGRLERDGKIEVSSEVDTLSEGYESLKQELDKLLTQVNAETRLAETRLAETALKLQLEIDEKTHRLTRIAQDIERASEHYQNLKVFLQNLGSDPNKRQLTFDKHLLLSSGSVSDVAAISDPLDSEF